VFFLSFFNFLGFSAHTQRACAKVPYAKHVPKWKVIDFQRIEKNIAQFLLALATLLRATFAHALIGGHGRPRPCGPPWFLTVRSNVCPGMKEKETHGRDDRATIFPVTFSGFAATYATI